jgi:hypothetical protein
MEVKVLALWGKHLHNASNLAGGYACKAKRPARLSVLASVAKLVDAAVSKTEAVEGVRVRAPPDALLIL